MKFITFISLASLPCVFLAGIHYAPVTIEPPSFYEDAVRVAYEQGRHDGAEGLLITVLDNGELTVASK